MTDAEKKIEELRSDPRFKDFDLGPYDNSDILRELGKYASKILKKTNESNEPNTDSEKI
jgi:hypothetical protein